MPDTLLSVSQIFASGDSNEENVAIFTADGVRVFDFDSVKVALKQVHRGGIKIIHEIISYGILIIAISELL